MKKAFTITNFDLSKSTHKSTDNLVVLFYYSSKDHFPTQSISLINKAGVDVLFINSYLINLFKFKDALHKIDEVINNRSIYVISMKYDLYFKFYLKNTKNNILGKTKINSILDEETLDKILPGLLSKNK